MKPLILALVALALNLNTSWIQLGPPPVASTAPLIQPADLVYQGAFRLPAKVSDTKTFAYGGTGLSWNPARGTLMAITLAGEVAEFSAPPAKTGTLAQLTRALLVQSYTDVLAGHRTDKGKFVLGGLLPLADRLIVSGYIYYDAGSPKQSLSHWRAGMDFAHLPPPVGPVQLGAANQGAWVGGYMTPIPPEWQGSLGGTALTGQCCLSVVARTSYGPSVSVFNPLQVGGGAQPVAAVRVLGYPSNHPNLGSYTNGKLFNGATVVTGVAFPGGTRSVLFFGRLGQNRCYGEGTSTKALDGTLNPDGVRYCYDPTSSRKGEHGYPYKSFVWAFDANDLAAVKAGTKAYYDVLPYAHWELPAMPFQVAARKVIGAAYDPATRRVFLVGDHQDGTVPLVQAYTLK